MCVQSMTTSTHMPSGRWGLHKTHTACQETAIEVECGCQRTLSGSRDPAEAVLAQAGARAGMPEESPDGQSS